MLEEKKKDGEISLDAMQWPSLETLQPAEFETDKISLTHSPTGGTIYKAPPQSAYLSPPRRIHHHDVHHRHHHTHVLRTHLATQAAIRNPVLSRALAQTASSARTDKDALCSVRRGTQVPVCLVGGSVTLPMSVRYLLAPVGGGIQY